MRLTVKEKQRKSSLRALIHIKSIKNQQCRKNQKHAHITKTTSNYQLRCSIFICAIGYNAEEDNILFMVFNKGDHVDRSNVNKELLYF